MNDNIKNFDSLVEFSAKTEHDYINTIKNYIIRKCEEKPSIKKLIDLIFNYKEYISDKNNPHDEKYYMYFACNRIYKEISYLFTDNGTLEGYYEPIAHIVSPYKFSGCRILNIAKFISRFFSDNDYSENEEVLVKFCPVYTEKTFDFFVRWKYIKEYGKKTNINDLDGYTRNPDDWIEFIERYAKEVVTRNAQNSQKNS